MSLNMENKESPNSSNPTTNISESQPNSNTQLQIPQFVLLQEPITNTFQHPQVLFVFEDETVPDSISKENCIIIDFDETGNQIIDTRNYSPEFYLHHAELLPNHPFTPSSASTTTSKSTNLTEDTTLLIEGVFSRNSSQKPETNLVQLIETEKKSTIQLVNELEREFCISHDQFHQYLNC